MVAANRARNLLFSTAVCRLRRSSMCAQGNPISWARVFDFLASKDIRNIYGRPGITQTQLLEDLALLQGYFPDKYLTGTLGPPEVRAGISDLIVQRVETTGFF